MLSRTRLPRAPALFGRRLASSSSTRPSRRAVPARRPSRRPQPQPQPRFSPSPSSATSPATSTSTTPGPDSRKTRRIVLTGAVALITAAGALTGAWLKTDHDASKQGQEVQELSVEERIAMLESRRAELVRTKMPLERKLTGLRERVEAQRSLAEKKMMIQEETGVEGSK